MSDKPQNAKVEVWLTQTCPYCRAAVKLLHGHGIEFTTHDLSDHPDRRAATDAILPGHRTVPLVLIDGDAVGGFTELEGIAQSGALVERVFGTN